MLEDQNFSKENINVILYCAERFLKNLNVLDIFIASTNPSYLRYNYVEKLYLYILEMKINQVGIQNQNHKEKILAEIEQITKLISLKEQNFDLRNYFFKDANCIFQKNESIIEKTLETIKYTLKKFKFLFYESLDPNRDYQSFMILKKSVEFIRNDQSNKVLKCLSDTFYNESIYH